MNTWVFPIVILYDELVVRCSTTGLPSFRGFLFLALFSLAYGCLCSVPGALFPEGKKRTIANRTVLVLLTVFFLTHCFIYLQFKVFYDLRTITNGAGGVVTHYKRDIWLLIKSPAGIRSIVLLFLPLMQSALLESIIRRDREDREAGKEVAEAKPETGTPLFLVQFVSGLAVLFVAVMTARALPFSRESYDRHYDFQTAISSFGLVTATRLDAVRIATGADQAKTFEETKQAREEEILPQPVSGPDRKAETAATTQNTQTAPPAEPVKEYGYSVLDIDFEKIASSGGVFAEIDAYAAKQIPSHKNEYTGLFAGKNLIFISAEAFSGYVADKDRTPTLYRMMTKGIQIKDFYQAAGAGTTGGEYQNLFGLLPTAGGASMMRKVPHHNYMTMGTQLDALGYYGQAFHNGDVGYYNRDVTHEKLGYSEGFMAHWNGLEKLMDGDTIYSDREMIRATFPLYADKEPFNIYYMTISGHSPYGRHVNFFSGRHWDRVVDPEKPEEVNAFLAANMEVEDMLTLLVTLLEEKGIADDTVIVMSPDHFPYGLSYGGLQALYGHSPDTNLKRDRNGAIIWSGCLEEEEPVVVDAPVMSLDLLPTLLNLFGLPWDSRLFPGRDILSDAEPLVFNGWQDWKTELGTYTASTGTFTPAEGVSAEDIPEGYVDAMRKIVRNKNVYCQRLTEYDYYYHVFGEEGPRAFVTGDDREP